MRNSKEQSVYRARGTNLLIPGLFFLLFLGALFLTLNFFMVFRSSDPNQGKHPVYATREPVPGYTQIRKEHLDIIYLPTIPDVAINDPREIVGRVLGRDKRAGYVFTESDFLPEGTKPGIVAGIPPDKRAFTVEVDKVPGLYGLQRGDTFDITALFKTNGSARSLIASPKTGIPTGEKNDLLMPQQIVTNGLVIEPLRVREVPFTDTSITQGTRTRLKPVREAVIAVAEGEIELLAQAVSSSQMLFLAPRSGMVGATHSDNNLASAMAAKKRALLRTVEALKGPNRQRLLVPNG